VSVDGTLPAATTIFEAFEKEKGQFPPKLGLVSLHAHAKVSLVVNND
jgi:hypothetical protein